MGTSVTLDIERNGTNQKTGIDHIYVYDNSKLQDRRDGNVSKKIIGKNNYKTRICYYLMIVS